MRRVTFLCFLALAAGFVISSCGTNTPAPPWVEATWQVRCLTFAGIPMTTGCTEPPQRSVYGYDGTGSQDVVCSIRESGGLRTINFSSYAVGEDGVRYGIALSNATIPVGGGSPSGTACRFSFDDMNHYQGECGAAAPSMTGAPCQVGPITFGEFEGSPTMEVPVYCIEAPNTVDSSIHRGITQAGSGMGQNMQPFTVTFYDCPVSH
jgi:hypothetical protein